MFTPIIKIFDKISLISRSIQLRSLMVTDKGLKNLVLCYVDLCSEQSFSEFKRLNGIISYGIHFL